jgi:uncharacterized protein YbjT (DUF2867 family)
VKPVLLTGATGHVGGRLLEALLDADRPVRALARTPEKLEARENLEIVSGDVTDRASLDAALAGTGAAYYLVHSLGSTGAFEDAEVSAAETFAAAAHEAGSERIVYLGGLARGDDLSDHLRSRQEVGRVLRESGVATIEFRASVVIGEGSASFELIRSLVDDLPGIVAPDWIETLSQPIALDDVIAYLVAALDVPLEESRVYEIGGADTLSYREAIQLYAGLRGLQTPIVEVPAVALPFARLADVLPERARVAAKLIESLRFESTVADDSALRDFAVRPRGAREAIESALAA